MFDAFEFGDSMITAMGHRRPGLIRAIMAAVLAVMFTLTLGAYLDRPSVFVSMDTDQCLRAEDYRGNPISCEEGTKGWYEVNLVPR